MTQSANWWTPGRVPAVHDGSHTTSEMTTSAAALVRASARRRKIDANRLRRRGAPATRVRYSAASSNGRAGQAASIRFASRRRIARSISASRAQAAHRSRWRWSSMLRAASNSLSRNPKRYSRTSAQVTTATPFHGEGLEQTRPAAPAGRVGRGPSATSRCRPGSPGPRRSPDSSARRPPTE